MAMARHLLSLEALPARCQRWQFQPPCRHAKHAGRRRPCVVVYSELADRCSPASLDRCRATAQGALGCSSPVRTRFLRDHREGEPRDFRARVACGRQGKKFRTENPVFRKIFRFRCYPESIFRPNFGFFGFKIQKFKKNHKNKNRIFPTGFRCFPVGFRCFSGGKDCFSNVKNILVYMVLQKNYYTCIYNLNTKYPFKFRKNNISLT